MGDDQERNRRIGLESDRRETPYTPAAQPPSVPERSKSRQTAKPDRSEKTNSQADILPSVTVPKGGGAIRGLGEKFSINVATGTATMALPLPLSPGRAGFTPSLQLTYDSGSGNGPFGFGWRLDAATITRKTDKGLPRYCDGDESDVFILSGAEDLVPILDATGARKLLSRTVHGTGYRISFYRPRIEGSFARTRDFVLCL